MMIVSVCSGWQSGFWLKLLVFGGTVNGIGQTIGFIGIGLFIVFISVWQKYFHAQQIIDANITFDTEAFDAVYVGGVFFLIAFCPFAV